jgi:hypothetical protein
MDGRDLNDRGPNSEDEVQPILSPCEEAPVVWQIRAYADDNLNVEDERQSQLALVENLLVRRTDVHVPSCLEDQRS